MSTNRNLTVRFVGDASNLKKSFSEVSAGATTAGAGLKSADSSASSVGQSFVKTGKVARGVGRAFRSSGADAAAAGSAFASTIPALSGVAGGAGSALLALDSLSGIAMGSGPAGLAVLGGAAIAAAAAYAFLHDDVSAATDALRDQTKLNQEIAASHAATGRAVDAQKQALHALREASISQKEAAIGLEQANIAVAESEKKSGKSSLEHRSALLAQQRAQESVRTSREDLIHQAGEVIRTTHESNKEIDGEVASTKKAAETARGRARGLAAGVFAGKDAAGVAKQIKQALDAEAKASATAAAKHRDNAQRAREAADAMGSATPKARALRDRLLELSRTELNTAQWIEALNRVTGAADSAAAAIGRAISAAEQSASTDPTPRGGGGGRPGGVTPRSLFSKGSDEVNARGGAPRGTRRGGSATPLTAADAAALLITGRHRDDSLQDKQARGAAEAGAGGVTNPDKLSAIGDKAVAEARRAELTADAANVKTAIGRVNTAIGKKRTRVGELRRARAKLPAKKQGPITEKIRALLDQIRALFDERRALNADAAEIKAEGAELDFDIAGLSTAISSLPDSVAADPGTSASPDTGIADPGVSADAQAQIDQANARAGVAARGQALAEGFARVLFGSPSIDPGAGATVVNNVYIQSITPGDPQIKTEVANWIVGALGTQGSVTTSAFSAGV